MAIFRKDIIDDESHINEGFLRDTRITYRVYAPPSMESNAVRSGLGIGIFDLHPTDSQQLVKGISVRLQEKSLATYQDPDNPLDSNNGSACKVWNATVEYGPWDPLEHSATGAPQDQPVRVEFEGITDQEIADVDKDGNPVINTAYEDFDPPVTRDRTRPVIRIIRNELTFSDSTILAYSDKVNSDTFYSYPARTLKCSAPRGVQRYSQVSNVNYFEVAYQLEYNPKTWDVRVLNRGYRELKTIGGVVKQVQVFDGRGQPIVSPQFLDSSGHALPMPVDDSNIVELRFRVYDELAFTSAFSLPTGLLT